MVFFFHKHLSNCVILTLVRKRMGGKDAFIKVKRDSVRPVIFYKVIRKMTSFCGKITPRNLILETYDSRNHMTNGNI